MFKTNFDVVRYMNMFQWIKNKFKWIAVGAIGLFLCVFFIKQLSPFFMKEKAASEEMAFKQSFERHIYNDVSQILDRIVGKNTFYISVSATLPSQEMEEEIINRTPNTFTETRHEKVERKGDFLQEQKGDFPSTAVQSQDIELDQPLSTRLPGLIKGDQKRVNTELPGFPLLSAEELDELDAKNLPSLLPGDLSELRDPSLTEKNSHYLTRETEDNLVYYNEEKSLKKVSRKNIKSLFVSVVIDQASFDLLDIQKEDIEALVSHVAGIQLERGDALLITYLPFVSSPFNIQRFYLKNKPMFKTIFNFLERSQWYIFGGILVFLMLWAFVKVYKTIRASMEAKKQRQAELDKKKEEVVQKDRQLQLNELEKKQNAIFKLASTKPEEFASLLLNWLEVAERETNERADSEF